MCMAQITYFLLHTLHIVIAAIIDYDSTKFWALSTIVDEIGTQSHFKSLLEL